MSLLHVINAHGERKGISWPDYVKSEQSFNGHQYTVDMDYYSEENGYISSKKLIERLKNATTHELRKE